MVILKDPFKYRLIKFEKSNTKHKKYDAILKHIGNGKIKRIPFGDKRYEQYKDSTGLDLYSHKDHGDRKRLQSYRMRHAKTAKNKFSSSWFSWHFLWRP